MQRLFGFASIGLLCLMLLAVNRPLQAQNLAQWVPTSLTNQTVQSLASNGTTILAAVAQSDSQDVVYRSDDLGSTWTLKSTGLPADNFAIYDLKLLGTTTTLMTTSNGIYRSANRGDTWTTTSLSATDPVALALSPAGVIYAGGIGKVYVSTDGGVHWTANATGLPANSFIYAVAVSPKDGSVYAAGGVMPGGGRVWRTDDNGASWTEVFNRRNYEFFYSLAVSKNGYVFAGSQEFNGGRLYCSEDNGATWTLSLSAQSVEAIAIDPGNSILVAAGSPGSQGGVLRSTDLGKTWAAMNTGLTASFVYRLAIPSNQYLYIGTYNMGVYRSQFVVPVELSAFKAE